MAKHPFKKSKKEGLEAQIVTLYQAGNSFRKIALILKETDNIEISHESVRQIWESLSVDKLT